MKSIACWVGVFCLSLVAWTAEAQQPEPLQNPGVVSINNDEPRYPLLPYNTMELAIRGDIAASTYFESLNGTWKMRTFSDPAAADTTLTGSEISTDSWTSVQVPSATRQDARATIYRTTFKRPFDWINREVFVHIGPVSRAYYVFVNGQRVGYFEDSQSAAEFNITEYAEEGRNHLAIIAFSDPRSAILENQDTGRGTAIKGDVYVFSQPKVRMRDYVIDTRFAPDGSSGLFNLGVIVKTHLLNPKEVQVWYDLYAPDSTKVSWGRRDARFEMKAEDTVRFAERIPNIESWSHESPKLYTVVLRLQHEGRFTEYTTFKVGFREVDYDENGIRINGYPIDIRGVNYACPGNEAAVRRDLAAFRAQGVNLLRVENHPQRKWFYDLCDAYGIYVCDQANLDTRLSGGALEVGGTPANDTLWTQAYGDRVMGMYYASQNHPSVIMFSLGAEAGRGINVDEAYLRLKAEEKSRPVIYEAGGAEWTSDMVVGTPGGRNASDKRYTLRFESPESFRTSRAPQTTSVALRESHDMPPRVTVHNDCKISNLANFRVGYAILSGKKIVKEGRLTASARPKSFTEVEVPTDGLKPGKYTLHIYADHADLAWQTEKERLAEITRQLVIPKPPKAK